MGQLFDLGIISNTTGNQTSILFERLVPDIFNIAYNEPNQFVDSLWNQYCQERIDSSLNGTYFELILSTLFVRENLVPLYLQSQITFVPNVSFDLLLIKESTDPIVISAKTSLRERYKQADLEGLALKQVHRRAKNYLITLDDIEANRLKPKILNGDVLSLDNVIIANLPEFNDLILELKQFNYIESPRVQMVSASQIVRRTNIHH